MQKVILNKKKITALNYTFSALLFMLLVKSCPTHSTKTRKAIFVIIDGIPANVIERVETPAPDAISKGDSYARSYVGGE